MDFKTMNLPHNSFLLFFRKFHLSQERFYVLIKIILGFFIVGIRKSSLAD